MLSFFYIFKIINTPPPPTPPLFRVMYMALFLLPDITQALYRSVMVSNIQVMVEAECMKSVAIPQVVFL